MPWARPNARHTNDFENVAAWLTQRMDKASIARLLRCSWETVDAIVTRVVVDHIDDTRLDNLYRIGADEISYKRGRKFLTIVADHDTGNVVWVGKERSKAAFEEFFAALGPERSRRIGLPRRSTYHATVFGSPLSGGQTELLAQPAVWAVPLAFTVMVAGSLPTRGRVPADVGATMLAAARPGSRVKEA